MAKLVLAAILLVFSGARASTLKLDLVTETSLPAKLNFNKVEVGGLSGIFWDGQHLWAVCDDRGKFGSPRVYQMDLKIKSSTVELTVLKSIEIKNASTKVLDLEGVAPMPDGGFLLSSEGDNNKKPRELPKIFTVNSHGEFHQDLPIPDKFLPELLGQQKKGIENNRGFEGLTVSADGKQIYAMNETPIMGDQSLKEDAVEWLRLVQFSKDKNDFKVAAEYPYVLDTRSQNKQGPEVFRGVSEVLHWKDQKFVTLERGARVSAKGVSYSGALYLADFQGTKDVSKVSNLSEAKISSARKEKLADLEDLAGSKKVENFEGLAWGPNLSDGRKTLLVISDNNFSSREKTQLLIFAVKEVE